MPFYQNVKCEWLESVQDANMCIITYSKDTVPIRSKRDTCQVACTVLYALQYIGA